MTNAAISVSVDSSRLRSTSDAAPLGVLRGEDLVQRYGPHLRRAVYKALRAAGWLPRREQVDELLQEVYCHLFAAEGRRLDGCRAGSAGQAAAFLSRVAERVVVDHLRRISAEKRGRSLLTAWKGSTGVPVFVDPTGGPEERLLGAERRRLLLARCATYGRPSSRDLRPRDLQILHLALIEGWSSPEIAQSFGGDLAPSSVDSLIHRLRRRLAAGGVVLPRRTTR